MLEADAAAKTANTAPKLPAITQAVKNTIFFDEKTIMETAKMDQDAGANRFAMVTSGRALTGKDFDKSAFHLQGQKKT